MKICGIVGCSIVHKRRYTGGMDYTITDNKQYAVSAETLRQATLAAVAALEGKVEKDDASTGEIVVKFNKTILGKVLGDRTHFELTVLESADGAQLDVTAFPLDAVGRKLHFGARKGVTKTVLSWLHAHTDHQLKKLAEAAK